MSTDVVVTSARPAAVRPGPARLVSVLTGHAVVSFLRTPTASFFTLLFPVSFLVIVGAIVGNQVTADGVRASQFLVAPFAVFGVAEGAFCVLAVGFATLRDSGVLKRLRGSPVPGWAVLASRVLGATLMSAASVLVLVLVGVLGYGVRPVWSKAGAAALTLLVGIVCCAALGLAVVALTRSVLATQALTNGVLIPLAFISHVFIGDVPLPTPVDWVSRALPLRHFADALVGTFDPLTGGRGYAWGDLAVLAAWAVAGGAVAVWRFGWEPRGGGRLRSPAAGPVATNLAAPAGTGFVPAPRSVGRPSAGRMLAVQVRYALTGLGRERLPVFFAVVFPAILLVLFPAIFPPQSVNGTPFADALLPGMIAYAVAVAGYVNLPEAVVRARAAGVLKRLRGTPLPPWGYLAGRLASAVLVGAAATAVLVMLAVLVNDTSVDPVRLPAVAAVVVAGGVCFGSVGLLLLALMPSARTVTAVTLGTLVPLSFVSDVFYVGGELPRPLQVVGDLFPLKPVTHMFVAALQTGTAAPGFAWADLAVVAAWTFVGLLFAARMSWYERA